MNIGSLIFLIVTVQIVLSTQPEAEEVSLTKLYNFLTNDRIGTRFTLQIIGNVSIYTMTKKNECQQLIHMSYLMSHYTSWSTMTAVYITQVPTISLLSNFFLTSVYFLLHGLVCFLRDLAVLQPPGDQGGGRSRCGFFVQLCVWRSGCSE